MEDEEDEGEFLRVYSKSYGYSGTIDSIREREFKRLGEDVYLDHTAATLYPQSLLDKYFKDLSDNIYGNPHSRNPSSQVTTEIINETRNKILQHFNTNSDEYSVIFTSGATAALKLVAECFPWKGSSLQSLGSCLCFLQNSHTSVVGIREVAIHNGARVICIEDKDTKYKYPTNYLPRKDIPNGLNREIVLGSNEELHSKNLEEHLVEQEACPSLFVFPAMCNFSGEKYPLNWIEMLHNSTLYPVNDQLLDPSGKWYVMLDAASFVSTSYLDLQQHKADFVPVSFYKIFGFPTSIGALIVRNKSAHVLKKVYYGGGTVVATLSSEQFHILRPSVSDRFEDGTLPFLDIIALGHAFETLYQLTGKMHAISEHTFSLAQFVYKKMITMTHGNGSQVCRLYCGTDFTDLEKQGPIINFNLLRSNGTMIGYGEVDKFACLFNIHLRTGSFCNTGASQQHLGISNQQLKKNYAAGHVCGDDVDLVDGLPTGSVRISFGYNSTFTDAQKFLKFIRDCFIETKVTLSSSKDFMRTEPKVETGRKSIEGIDRSGCVTGYNRGVHRLPSVGLNDTEYSCLVLQNIYLYPIKSCGAFEVSKWEIGPRGLMYDRQWMIINESKICLSQKREPRLCLIKPSVDTEKGILMLDAPGMSSLTIPLVGDSKVCKAKVNTEWLEEMLDCGEEAARWITLFLGKKCRLVQQKPDDSRKSKVLITGTACSDVPFESALSLANVSQYLVICKSSVAKLHKNIEITSGEIKDDINELLSRFRGNLVIGGSKAFDEDQWKIIQIGQHLFQLQGLCTRCQMICLDQRTAERTVEPLKTLGLLRGSKLGTFGIGLVHSQSDCSNCEDLSPWLQVGDQVNVIK